jgi:hypothetical protein
MDDGNILTLTNYSLAFVVSFAGKEEQEDWKIEKI